MGLPAVPPTFISLAEDYGRRKKKGAGFVTGRRFWGGQRNNKVEQAILVAKEIFNKLGELKLNNPPGQPSLSEQLRGPLRVYMTDVREAFAKNTNKTLQQKIDKITVAIEDRKDKMGKFCRIHNVTTQLGSSHLLAALGPKTANVQLRDETGAPLQVTDGWANIGIMNVENVKRNERAVQELLQDANKIDDDAHILAMTSPEEVKKDLLEAKRQLTLRNSRLERLALEMPGRLRDFRRDATVPGVDRSANGNNPLYVELEAIKRDLDAIGPLYKGNVAETKRKLKNLFDKGKSPRGNNSQIESLDEPPLTTGDLLKGTAGAIGCFAVGSALATASVLPSLATIMTGWVGILMVGLATVMKVNYSRGGIANAY